MGGVAIRVGACEIETAACGDALHGGGLGFADHSFAIDATGPAAFDFLEARGADTDRCGDAANEKSQG